MSENPADKPGDNPGDNPQDPALSPTDHYDEAAIKRARELLNNMPESVGPYRILERIGGGGMGEVYRAEQRAPIRRQVALKFIKLGMDSKAVLARFEAERQALALMDHPHIAKVFDAGTDDTGRPYFVMEYVKGKPITDYADRNQLTIRERLELFEQVCQAIQHAHHKGVIHRDLKPGNVLVSTQDDRPFAKVIDFGIAKAIAQRLTDETLFTQHDQFLGTPQYMSPEQAEGSVDIDTRTDVYSLGVLLYELLTGSTPFSTQDLRAAAFEQLKRLIIEVDPPKPSTRLTLNQPTLSTLAASRRTEPKRLGTLVQGELDWIVMKSLEKDRKRRYETPTSLASDIQAHLQGEPVQAAPPSTVYRIQKFVKKHRGPVAAVAAVLLTLVLGIAGTAWQSAIARDEAKKFQHANETLADQKNRAINGFKDILEASGLHRNSIQYDPTAEPGSYSRLLYEDPLSVLIFEGTGAVRSYIEANAKLEGALARGFVRPLVGADVLTQPEIESLWELATLENDTVCPRMLDEATRNSQMTEQLLNCAEPALVAAIGLNPDLRQQALTLLRPRLTDQTFALDHRASIAWITLMLLDQPGPDSAACVALIKNVFASENSDNPIRMNSQSYCSSHPIRVASLLQPAIAAEILLAALADPKLYPWQVKDLAKALVVLSARLEKAAARRVCESVSGPLRFALADPEEDFYQEGFYQSSDVALALSALSVFLEPDDAARSGAAAANALFAHRAQRTIFSHEYDLELSSAWATSLASLDTDAAAHIADGLLAVIADLERDDKEYHPYRPFLELLPALSKRLEPDVAARLADGVFTVFSNPKRDDVQRAVLLETLPALAPHLELTAAALIADGLLVALSDHKRDAEQMRLVAKALTTCSVRLEPSAAARVCESASDTLLAALADPKWNGFELSDLSQGVAVLSERLEPIAAARVCQSASNMLLAALSDPQRDPQQRCSLAWPLNDLAAKLDRVSATRVRESASDAMLAVLSDPKYNFDTRGVFFTPIYVLNGLADKLEPITAARVADGLLATLSDPKWRPHELSALAATLFTYSERLVPDPAARVCQSASDTLFTILADPKINFYGSCSVAKALSTLQAGLDSATAKRFAFRAARLLTHPRFEQRLLEDRSPINSVAKCTRNLVPQLRQSILRELFALELEQPSKWVRQVLTVMQRQEPHHATMAAPPDDKTATTDHAFSTLKLTTPEIVEFLKSPLVQGDHRRAFLDLLECRYGRRFGNQWAFVEYAQAENLGLDFTTRVKRPDPKTILQNIRTLLDQEVK